MRFRLLLFGALLLMLSAPFSSAADDLKIKIWQAKISEYKQWLDAVGSTGSRLWLRLDSSRRPHRLYLGDGFYLADEKTQETFVEIFSHYLAGHPEKFMLVDLFDGQTEAAIGEFGWGGFRLYEIRNPGDQRPDD